MLRFCKGGAGPIETGDSEWAERAVWTEEANLLIVLGPGYAAR